MLGLCMMRVSISLYLKVRRIIVKLKSASLFGLMSFWAFAGGFDRTHFRVHCVDNNQKSDPYSRVRQRKHTYRQKVNMGRNYRRK